MRTIKRLSPVQLNWRPNKNSAMPIYQQIVQFVCSKVGSGQWPVGTRLPSQRTLAQLFSVNRSTVTTALEELMSYGVVATYGSAGTQIISNTWALLLSNHTPNWNHYLSSGSFKANQVAIQIINQLEFSPAYTRLGTGELDTRLFPKEMWQKVLQSVGQSVTSLGYLEPLGLLPLRQAISDYLRSQGIDAPPACILITSGSLQALQLISVGLLQPGSTIYTEAPSYLKSLQLFQSSGMQLQGIPMEQKGISLQVLEAALQRKHRHASPILYTIPTNQNPTGITMDQQRRHTLMELCSKYQLPIIEDGAYQDLYFEQQPQALKTLDKTGMVIHLGSVSKSLAPGLRVGWIVAAEPIVQRLSDVKMQMDYGASSVSQWIVTEFFRKNFYTSYLQNLRNILKQRRDAALTTLEQHFSDLATWNKPQGGFYIWLTLQKKISMEQLFQQAIQTNLLLNPGGLYDFQDNSALRLSYAYTTCEEFATAAEQLSQLIRRM